MAKKKTGSSFEDNLLRLQEIVSSLDSEGIALDETITLYEEGIGLLEKSVTELSSAQSRIKELRKRSEGVFELLDTELDDE